MKRCLSVCSRVIITGILLPFVLLQACAGADAQSDRTPASAILSQPPVVSGEKGRRGAAATTTERPEEPTTSEASVIPPLMTPPDLQAVTKARALMETGLLHYRTGSYDKAESALKEAITLYPFVAEANLLLGKIFLLKGSAARDLSLVRSARLMFEMAHTIDPTLREAEVLLDLFKNEPAE